MSKFEGKTASGAWIEFDTDLASYFEVGLSDGVPSLVVRLMMGEEMKFYADDAQRLLACLVDMNMFYGPSKSPRIAWADG